MPSRLPSLKVVLIVLAPCMLALGIWLGGHTQYLPDPVADALLGSEDRRVTLEALDTIHDRYYRSVGRGALSNNAIDGAVNGLDDRFSSYLPPKSYARLRQSISNEFSGIGVGVNLVKAGLRVSNVYPDSPAEKAGLRAGDVITKANGRALSGLAEEAAVALVKGPKGTPVTLTLRRGKRTFQRRIVRAPISIQAVSSKIANAGGTRVAYISLSTFELRNAHDQVAAAIRRLKGRGAKGIVFDLRGNGGGLVTEAQRIASMFLPDGPIVTTRGRTSNERTLRALGDPIAGRLPTVVLVDGGSASASEIVAGALQDRKRAQLVGERTYGKGIFQNILELETGGALILTGGQYFLPSGRNIGGVGTKKGKGLEPDVTAKGDPTTKRDEALDKALDVLAADL